MRGATLAETRQLDLVHHIKKIGHNGASHAKEDSPCGGGLPDLMTHMGQVSTPQTNGFSRQLSQRPRDMSIEARKNVWCYSYIKTVFIKYALKALSSWFPCHTDF